MRLKIKFSLNGNKQIMPLNNNYPISSWIYKVLSRADNSFTKLLHDEGYILENGKTFKLFTFSPLYFPKHTWKIVTHTDRMEVWAKKAWLTVSFHLPEQSEKFVMGLFKDQKAFIGDKKSGIELKVECIEAIKTKLYDTKVVKLRTISPIVMGITVDGFENEQYVPPIHFDYKRVFLQNLLDKYSASGKNNSKIEDIDFYLTKLYPKTSMQTIKAFTAAETKVKGYYYEFELKAPKEIIEVGLNAGFGSMNSLGFGFCEVIGNN